MADPDISFQYVLSNECRKKPDGSFDGAIIKDIDGGQTRYGIDSLSHPEALAAGFYAMNDHDALTYAFTLFKFDYFNMILGYQVASQRVATKYSDMAFNQYWKQATKIVQRAVNTLRTPNNQIAVDGAPGSNTVAAINAADENLLLEAIVEQGQAFYTALRNSNPQKYSDAVYNGWMNRVKLLPPA